MRGKVALAVVIFGAIQFRVLSASAQIIQTVAGGGLFINRIALQISLKAPTAVGYGPNGTAFVTDGNRVEQFNPLTGLITTVAGNGTQGYSGDGGLATSAELDDPSGVAVDGAGNLYISDSGNQRIRMVSAATGFISTVVGNGTRGYSGDGALATSASLNAPAGLAVDSAGNLYIADSSNCVIRKVSAGSGIITTTAGEGSYGYSGDGGVAISAQLASPGSVAVDGADNLYIADSDNERIRMVSAATGIISTVAGSGTKGFLGDGGVATSAELASPSSVAVDGAGNVYIADSENERIRVVSAASGIITTVAGSGTHGYSGDGGPATSADLNFPTGIALDGAGNVFVADASNSVIREVSAASGIITTVAGNGSYGYFGDGGAATNAGLTGPSGVAVDRTGNLYIADTGNERIRVVNAGSGIISTAAGDGFQGYRGDSGLATSAELNSPIGVAVDGAGNLYIADAGNSVVRKVSGVSGVIVTAAGDSIQGYSGDTGAATSAELNLPLGVALDGVGNLYIADTNNAVVRKVDAVTGIISTVAGNGSYGYFGDGGPATNAELASPCGVALDGVGNLYIADTNNAVIRKVDAITGVISTVAGNGSYGYSGDGGPATSAELNSPIGIAMDGAGNLYIADTSNSVIRKVSVGSGIISTVAGNGGRGYSGDGGPATSAELDSPYGVTVSSSGSLYIVDFGNNSVREVSGLLGSASPPVVTPVVGGILGNNDWYTSNVSVSWTVSSGTSPILSQSGCGAVTIATDTSRQTITCSATSGVGTTTQSITIKRDATPPTISVTTPTSGATYIIGSTIIAAYTCADSTSGPANCIGTAAVGGAIGTAGAGGQTFTVTATDQAGNVAQTSIGYTVALASQTVGFAAPASQPAGTQLALRASASSGLPVTFSSSTVGVCTVSGSVALLLSAGNCTITASQGGNAIYAAATPITQSFSVTAKLKSNTVTLGISSGTQVYSVRNTFAIGPSYTGSPVPTGTVTLSDNGVALVTLTLGTNGIAYYTANPLSVGANVLIASYSGDSHFAPGVSAPITLNITPAPVKLTGSCWGGTPYKVAYQCVVTATAATATPPTGSITYSLDGGGATGVALNNGTASFSIATLPAAGAHKLTIAYAGQGDYASSASLTEPFTTAPGQTQLLISPSSYYLPAGSRITLTATASTSQSGAPTGSVTFYDNGAPLGTATIGSNGTASYIVANIPKGTNTYTAKYAATANYAAATSGGAAVTAH